MRKFLFTAVISTCMGGGLANRAAAQINVSTGLDASNNLIATGGVNDAHWTVPPQSGGGAAAAQTVYPNNADYGTGYWAANGPNSA